MEIKTEYKTKGLAEAAALLTKKQSLVNIERKGNICWFVFEDRIACKRISNHFFFGELLVNAREFTESINRLKNRIFADEAKSVVKGSTALSV